MLEPDTTIQYSDPPVYGKCSPSNPLGRLELLLRLVLKVTENKFNYNICHKNNSELIGWGTLNVSLIISPIYLPN